MAAILAVAVLASAFPCVVRADDAPRAPQPISASDLARYGDMLRLSDEQRFAIEGLYEHYLDEFEPLRLEMMELAMRHPVVGGVGEGDAFTGELPRLVSRVRAIDESFFNEIEPLLTPHQLEDLPRVRRLRERTVYTGLAVMEALVGDGVADLSVLLDDLDLPAEIVEPMRPAIQSYEDRLTRGLRGVFESAVRVCRDGDEATAERLVELVRSLRAMNRRAFAEFRAALPEEDGHRLHDEFFLRAYGTVQQAARPFVLEQYRRALNLPDLSDHQRETVGRLEREAWRHYEAVLEAMADFIDDDSIKLAGPEGARGSQTYLDMVNSTRREMMAEDREMRRALLAVIGEEHAEALRSTSPRRVHASGRWRMICGVVVFTNRLREIRRTESRPMWAGDSLLAAPMRREEFEEIVLHLVPDDDGREVLRELYRAYAEALEEELRPHHREHMTLLGFVPDETPEERRERRAKLPGLREKVRSIIEQADDRLFLEIRDALALVDDDPRWHRLRALRRRTARQIPTISGHGHDQNRAAEVDLVSVLIAVPLTPEEWEAIDAEVGDYEKRMLELLNARLAVIPVQEGTPAVFRAEDWEEIRRRGEAPHVAHREVTRFNQETVERLLEALPWETAWHVRDAFNRLAYPLAYDDPASMERVIAQAASLPDLGPAQRDQITEIRAEFTSAYEQVRSAILALCVEFEPDLVIAHLSRTLSPEKIEMKEHFTQHFAKLSDERAAVNRRALRGLRSALTPAQLRRLDLPHVE